MSDKKNEQQFSNIDKLLENFKNDIESNAGAAGKDFSSIVMPAPIVLDESSIENKVSSKKNEPYKINDESDTSYGYNELTTDLAFDILNLQDEDKSSVPQPEIFSKSITPVSSDLEIPTADNNLPAENIQESERETKIDEVKSRGNGFITFVKLLMIIFCLGCSVWLLSSGSNMNTGDTSGSEKNGAFVFKSSSANLLSASLSEIHSMPKIYLLEQNDDPAPMPDSSKFTKIDDPERKNYNGEKIDYYKDETIEVKCWKEQINSVIYNFAEIKIAHPSQFKRKLVDNVISNKHLDYPLNIFNSVNGVVGMTSDYCAFRSYGTIVQFGKIMRDNPKANLDLMIYDEEGNLSSMTNEEFNKSELYESDKVIYTFAFGPVLVDDYKVNTSNKMKKYPIGEVNDIYPRAAIGQFGYDKHYLLCTADYYNSTLQGTTVTKMAKVMQKKGCRFAYNMDGGQTGALMFNKKLFNYVAYGGQREVSDVMYFATAIPND